MENKIRSQSYLTKRSFRLLEMRSEEHGEQSIRLLYLLLREWTLERESFYSIRNGPATCKCIECIHRGFYLLNLKKSRVFQNSIGVFLIHTIEICELWKIITRIDERSVWNFEKRKGH